MNPDVESAILPEARYRISVEQYHQMIDAGVIAEKPGVELLEGVIVAVSPRSPEHARLIVKLLRLFTRALGDEWAICPQTPLTLARSEPEPDIAVVRQSVFDAATRHPTTASLVIEVSRSSMALDRAMAAVYAEANVTEYWIIDIGHQCIEVHREPDGAQYRTRFVASLDATLETIEVPGVSVVVAVLFERARH